MLADPAGEPLDLPVITVGDHRSDIHGRIPFRFDVKGELLPAVLRCQYVLLLLLLHVPGKVAWRH